MRSSWCSSTGCRVVRTGQRRPSRERLRRRGACGSPTPLRLPAWRCAAARARRTSASRLRGNRSGARRRPVSRSTRMLEPERILRLEANAVVFLDQRRLPLEEVDVRCNTAAAVADAIRTMVVRGAPAIGVAAPYGLALAAANREELDAADPVLRESRPTAVNLAWALDEMRDDPSAEHARRIHADEVGRCKRMAAHTAELLAPGTRALTHCNAGGLATGGDGSAVGAPLAPWGGGAPRARPVGATQTLPHAARV